MATTFDFLTSQLEFVVNLISEIHMESKKGVYHGVFKCYLVCARTRAREERRRESEGRAYPLEEINRCQENPETRRFPPQLLFESFSYSPIQPWLLGNVMVF
ncbi:hypothetical protein CMV_029672 [Castanea mollissima]|uniref:Uncharacterized protein n=1 Tax=Castanea mollissima TaxID=60419 RepID=A0A8J4Q4R4_9ROSI|nr:hypothetical protein CMV_029672 [Castanea mollissima]